MSLDDDQVLAGAGEQFRARFAHHERVLDPDPAAAGKVYTRFDGHRHTSQKCTGTRFRHSGCFMDLQPYPVTETVHELRAVPRFFDDRAGRGVDLAGLRSGVSASVPARCDRATSS